MNAIPYGRQSINESDIDAVVSALKGEFLTTGPLVEQFEDKLQQFVGAPCVVVSSGTAALHCAYAAIDLKPGDEVITPPMTFIATQATAAQFGAKIVFADIQKDTGNINPDAVSAAITSNTKAIVAVDYAGHPADLDELRALANKHHIYLIEDAAHSIGSTYKGRQVGSIADITTFSFFPTKNMTTAEGGAVASMHSDLLLRAKRFSRQGLIRNREEFKIPDQGVWHQEVHEFGLNYRLPDVLCALGLNQLSRLGNFKEKRTRIFEHYRNLLEVMEGLILPKARDYVSPMWHLYHLHVDEKIREDLYNYLRTNNILVQINYMPAHWHPVFKKMQHRLTDLSISEDFYKTEISLPMHTELDSVHIEYIVETLKNYFR